MLQVSIGRIAGVARLRQKSVNFRLGASRSDWAVSCCALTGRRGDAPSKLRSIGAPRFILVAQQVHGTDIAKGGARILGKTRMTAILERTTNRGGLLTTKLTTHLPNRVFL